ncbi:MAG: hypothetical protein HND57_11830 [Planctomycetes bacterium]|nr:hypothetical protein [Planctomycetota bacterium]
MTETMTDSLPFPMTTGTAAPSGCRDVLGDILRQGAQRLLAEAVEAEVATWIEARAHLVDERTGHRHVVRNGHLPERTLVTQVGPMTVRQPRVRDRRPAGQAEQFTSAILPPYLQEQGDRGTHPLAVSEGDLHRRLR